MLCMAHVGVVKYTWRLKIVSCNPFKYVWGGGGGGGLAYLAKYQFG